MRVGVRLRGRVTPNPDPKHLSCPFPCPFLFHPAARPGPRWGQARPYLWSVYVDPQRSASRIPAVGRGAACIMCISVVVGASDDLLLASVYHQSRPRVSYPCDLSAVSPLPLCALCPGWHYRRKRDVDGMARSHRKSAPAAQIADLRLTRWTPWCSHCPATWRRWRTTALYVQATAAKITEILLPHWVYVSIAFVG